MSYWLRSDRAPEDAHVLSSEASAELIKAAARLAIETDEVKVILHARGMINDLESLLRELKKAS